MKYSNKIISTFVTVAFMAGYNIQAQTLILKSNNVVTLDQAASWVPDTAPGTGDIAVWDSTVSTTADCTNTIAAVVSWGGILISNPAVSVKIATNGISGDSTGVSIGSLGITLTNSASLWIAPAFTTTADQSWTIGNGLLLELGEVNRNITVANNITINGAVSFPYEINDYGSFTIPAGSTLTALGEGSIQSLNVGTATGVGYVYQSGGTVTVGQGTQGGTTGSPKLSMGIANNGAYYISGGSLIDNSGSTGGRFDIGTSSGAGTLNISGTALVQADALYIANGSTGTINLTNGTLTIPSGVNFRVGLTSGTGTMNIYGGLVQSAATMTMPSGAGTGMLNVNAGTVNLSALSAGNTGPGTATVSSGVLNVTNSINLATSTGNGTLTLNGGLTTVTSITHGGAGPSAFNWNGGVLKARASSATFIASNITADVDSGGAIMDTTNLNVTILAPLLSGASPDGGLTKLGSGTLTLGGSASSYNGPTIVNGGTLALTTTNFTGGSILTTNAAGLQVTLANATTMNCSSLSLGTLGSSLGGSNILTFNLGAGNPGVPAITASSLAETGAVFYVINGTGLSIGTIPLIQYTGSIAGNDYSNTLSILSGAVGYITNNTSAQTVELVITGSPSLVWRALVNTNWDINATANWVNLSNNLPSVYPDGASVNFDDSTSNATVVLTNTVNPGSVTLNNIQSNYLFSGGGVIAGTANLTKTGAGTVMMALPNTYSGNTVISNGTFILGVANAIPGGAGRGSVTLEGKLNLAGFSDSINGLSGNNGIVDNTNAAPVVFSIGGNGAGTFAGLITNSSGMLTLNVSGGTEQLLSTNGYTGSTTNDGNLQLASVESISPAPLTLRGGSLYWENSSAQVLTNQVTLSGGSTIGAPTNGLTTFSNVACIVNGIGITANSAVLFADGVTNGPASGLTSKSGPGTLTLNNPVGDWTPGTFALNSGTIVFNGGSVIEDGNNFRIQCNDITNGWAYCIITNGALITLSNNSGANFRVGDSGDVSGCTNVCDIAGTVILIPQTPNTGNRLEFDGNASDSPVDVDIANLLPGGYLSTRQVANEGSVSGTFNFNGGTLYACTNDVGPTFMTGLIGGAYVLDGGAIINDGGFPNIVIGQALQAGGAGIGGLTKQGAGELTLTAASTYTGNTYINAGTLALGAIVFPPSAGSIQNSSNIIVAAGATFDISAYASNSMNFDIVSGQSLMGSGAVNGPVIIDSGATLEPGGFATTGVLTLTNPPTLNGEVLLKLNTGSIPSNDQVAVPGQTLNYGGALVVTNIGPTPAAGDTFYLFSAPGGSFSGSFSSMTLPVLPSGLGWTNNFLVDGSLTVTGAVASPMIPKFNSLVLSGGNLILSGTNGTASARYRVYSSTNVALPLASWTVVATNNFDGSGNFSFTNSVNPVNPVQFFDISVP